MFNDFVFSSLPDHCRTGFATPSVMFSIPLPDVFHCRTYSVHNIHCRFPLPDGVCKPRPAVSIIFSIFRQREKHYGRGCKPRPAVQTPSGSANPVRQCKPRPAVCAKISFQHSWVRFCSFAVNPFLFGPSFKKTDDPGFVRPVNKLFPNFQTAGFSHGGPQTLCLMGTQQTTLRTLSEAVLSLRKNNFEYAETRWIFFFCAFHLIK